MAPYSNEMTPAAKGKSSNRQYQGKPIFPLLSKHPVEQTVELYGNRQNRTKMGGGGNDRYNRSVEGLLYSKKKGNSNKAGPQTLESQASQPMIQGSQGQSMAAGNQMPKIEGVSRTVSMQGSIQENEK